MKKILFSLLFLCNLSHAQHSSSPSAGLSKSSAAATYVFKAGDTMTGQLTTASTITVQGSAFSVGGSTLVVANGNIGIRYANPTSALEVGGVTRLRDSLTLGSINIEGNWTWGATGLIMKAGISRDLRLGANDVSNHLVIGTGGNIGIGNTEPNTKLHISSGTITMDGTGAPPAGAALCLTAAGKMGTCTGGTFDACTCTAP